VKNPILAAVLNFFLFGAGTLYVGQRPIVGLLAMIGGTAVQVAEIYLSPAVTNQIPGVWPFFFAGLVTLKVALAIDGYQEARARGEAGGAAPVAA
jgi:hypothetical protein